jgi:Escherichia/Staphylococcus phage prohead protease
MSTTIERPRAPEQRTIDVDVEDLETRGRVLVGYAAVYGRESHDLGGYREKIAPGAFGGVLGADVRCLLNHDPSQVLGRTRSGTLRLHDEDRGLRFECDLPTSPLGDNVREAVGRGDIDGASFRFTVDGESWDGDIRTINTVKELHDVTVATYGAYPDASVELRTRPQKEEPEVEEAATLERQPEDTEGAEERTSNGGGLRVADINAGQPEIRTLIGAFRNAGWKPDRRAEIAWAEFEGCAESRALTFTSGVSTVQKLARDAGPYGADQRYAWPAFGRVGVDAGVTSVDVATQTARTLPTAANTVRALDAVTNKPEVANTITVANLALNQVAAVESGIPNVYLEQAAITSIVGTDLRLAVNEGLDKLVLDALAGSGFQAPGTDQLLVSIRKAMTTIYAAGYNPDTLILTPANAEALDVLVTGISGATADFVFGAGRFAPGQLFGMNVRVSKTIPAAAVVDANAFGKMYASPVSLATFEENAGKTNSSLVRMELHAVFGTERQSAAVRIAAS